MQVFEAIVVPDADDVVQRDIQAPASPLVDATLLAAVLLEAECEEPELDVASAACTADTQQKLDRHRLRARDDISPLHRLVPGARMESEVAGTPTHAMTVMVVALDSSPVVPLMELGLHGSTQPFDVVTHCWLGYPESTRDLTRGQSPAEEMLDPRSRGQEAPRFGVRDCRS